MKASIHASSKFGKRRDRSKSTPDWPECHRLEAYDTNSKSSTNDLFSKPTPQSTAIASTQTSLDADSSFLSIKTHEAPRFKCSDNNTDDIFTPIIVISHYEDDMINDFIVYRSSSDNKLDLAVCKRCKSVVDYNDRKTTVEDGIFPINLLSILRNKKSFSFETLPFPSNFPSMAQSRSILKKIETKNFHRQRCCHDLPVLERSSNKHSTFADLPCLFKGNIIS